MAHPKALQPVTPWDSQGQPDQEAKPRPENAKENDLKAQDASEPSLVEPTEKTPLALRR
jgi:hypothetical protein